MQDLDTREWLLTNGLGSFASGTICDVRTRTYHGWLFAAANPPTGRTLLFSHLEANLEIGGINLPLGTNFWGSGEIAPTGYKFLRSFERHPAPTWIYGEETWQLSREIIMPHGVDDNSHRLLIRYCYQGIDTAILKLRILIGDRDFHHQQHVQPEVQFSETITGHQICFQAQRSNHLGIPWHLSWTKGEYQAEPLWYWDYHLSAEKERGLAHREDLYSPGYLQISLSPGDSVTVAAQTVTPTTTPLTEHSYSMTVAAEQERLRHIFNCQPCHSIKQQLLKASDQFIVYRRSIEGFTVIAGYHWFNDWGRDTLISLPGLTITTKRFDLARDILQTFGYYCHHGLIPNVFPDVGNEPAYNSIDATLWWIETLGLYLVATEDWEFLAAQYPTVKQIYKAFMGGTHFNIQVDATDGLLAWDAVGVALTWMDVVITGKPVTPRIGKPVEINALWYSALCWMSQWAQRLSQIQPSDAQRLVKHAHRYHQQAEQVKLSLSEKFWNPNLGYLYDTIEPDQHRNHQIRPNAILALSLYHCAFTSAQGQAVVRLAASQLLTPYGLRSLAPTEDNYIGQYIGAVHSRDQSYHQGTVWAWLIGPFVRAWERFYPGEPLPFDWQPLIKHFLSDACVHSISEIFDGDYPHAPKGAVAQAWSLAEVIRHFPMD